MNEMPNISIPETEKMRHICDDPDSVECAQWYHYHSARPETEQPEEFKEYLKQVAEGKAQKPTDTAVSAMARLMIEELREKRRKTGE